MIALTALVDPSRTSLNQRLHPQERARRNTVAKQAALAAWTQAGCPKVNGPVRVSITVRRAKRLDTDNAISGCKPLIDGLFAERRRKGYPVEPGLITPDDSPEWLALGEVTQEIGPEWKGREQVIVRIEEL